MSLSWMAEYEQKLLAGDIAQAAEVKNKYMNRSFYKYRCFDGEGFWKDWAQGKLYANSPEYFNDPFDSFLTVSPEAYIMIQRDSLKDILSRLCKLSKLDRNRLEYSDDPIKASFEILSQWGIPVDKISIDSVKERIYAEFETKSQSIRKKLKVACFSEVYDSILMWSHYTNNHQGFCIEYKFESFLNISERIYPVVYSKKRPILLPEYMKASKKLFSMMVFKAQEWEYEKEWRYIIGDPKMTEEEQNMSIVLSVPNAIKSIYLGTDAIRYHSDLVKELSDIAKEKDVPLYEMRFHDSEYVLSPHKIDYI
jgi:hypothetical protein